MGLPRFGELRGKRVELTEEFVRSTPEATLALVTIETPEGKTIRPFRCLENGGDQIGLADDG